MSLGSWNTKIFGCPKCMSLLSYNRNRIYECDRCGLQIPVRELALANNCPSNWLRQKQMNYRNLYSVLYIGDW